MWNCKITDHSFSSKILWIAKENKFQRIRKNNCEQSERDYDQTFVINIIRAIYFQQFMHN